MAAGGALVGGALVWPWSLQKPTATIVRRVQPKFLNDHDPQNRDLTGRVCELSEGLIEITFHPAGASAVIEAPARFTVLEGPALWVESGRVVMQIPEKNSLVRVLTPEMEVRESGPCFAIAAVEEGISEVHVFEGTVEVADAERALQPTLVRANEALRFRRSQGPQTCPLRPATFVQHKELAQLTMGVQAGQLERAGHASSLLLQDPAHLLTVSHEAINDCVFCDQKRPRLAQGRFPGRWGFDFHSPEDAIRLQWAPHVRQFTLMTWVRMNLPSESGPDSLFHTDEWNKVGQIGWMVDPRGRMQFAIHGGPDWKNEDRRSPTALWVFSESSLNHRVARWLHLGVTYDADSRKVCMYIDGVLDVEAQVAKPLEAVLGAAEIGNWRPFEQRRRRQLSGRLDEFLVFSRVFSRDEVRSYFTASTPYPLPSERPIEGLHF
ncbi:LamG-like jellyroll fold domain-containing protein [Planctomicrobium sp. SH664]|uniref:LamG-like jellyroll fold domain-containing protein n=1 Tax=Planctomicrobium sp. SH664 TaxID=3448125 RepID=UPI003F5AFA40